jgi:hypothetical protein
MQLKLLLYYLDSKGPSQLVKRTGSTHRACPVVNQPMRRPPERGSAPRSIDRASVRISPLRSLARLRISGSDCRFHPCYLIRLHLLVDFVTGFRLATNARESGSSQHSRHSATFERSFHGANRYARLREAVVEQQRNLHLDRRSVELRALCNESPQTPPGPEGSNGSGSASCAAEYPKFLFSPCAGTWLKRNRAGGRFPEVADAAGFCTAGLGPSFGP